MPMSLRYFKPAYTLLWIHSHRLTCIIFLFSEIIKRCDSSEEGLIKIQYEEGKILQNKKCSEINL